jgi:hypothetical protein
MCFVSSLFILNMSVESVAKTDRNASSHRILRLFAGSCSLFSLIYAHINFTTCISMDVDDPNTVNIVLQISQDTRVKELT